MANENKTTENEVIIIGKLKEKNIKIEPTKEGILVAKGSVIIAIEYADGMGEIKVDVFQKEVTSKGNPNSLFKGIQTVVNTYKSAKEVGMENADLIRVMGSLEDRTYYSTNSSKIVEMASLKGVFFKRLTAEEGKIQGCNVRVFGYLNKIETKETGDLELEIVGINYNGAGNVCRATIPAEVAIAFQTNFSTGVTGLFDMEQINRVVVKEEIIKSDFGADIVKTIKNTESKLLVKGATIDRANPITAEEAKQALSVRENNIENKKQKDLESARNAGTSMQNTGSMGSFQMPTGNLETTAPTFMPLANFGQPKMA